MRLTARVNRGKNLALRCACVFSALALVATPALAHTTKGLGVGFVSGFTHPLTGLDHIMAMVAVGIWGTQLRKPAIWLLPVTFPLVMSVGGALGVRGVPLPGVEIGVAASAAVLGLMIVLAARPPIAVAAVHLTGIALGLMERWPLGMKALRGMGASITVGGVYLLLGLVR